MEEPQTYGDPAVNEVIAYLKGVRGIPTLDGSAQHNRRYAKMLLSAMKADYPDIDSVALVKRLIDIAQTDNWHRQKAAGMSWLYYKKGELIALGMAAKPKPDTGGYRLIRRE